MDSASPYSFSLTTFSPEGKLGQLDHAMQAVSRGATCIGVKCKDEKRLRCLIDPDSVEKLVRVHERCGLGYAGFSPDFRVLVKRARKYAESYRRRYNEVPSPAMVARNLAQVFQEYTQSGGVRPFGVSLLVAGIDKDESGNPVPMLYQVDTSGAYWAWSATALGKNRTNATSFLEKRYNADDSLSDAIHVALLTMKDGFGGEMTADNIELGVADWTSPDVDVIEGGEGAPDTRTSCGRFRILSRAELADYLH